ncbi:hypothetical protein ACKGJO_01090 [Gracilimonas sp. Q87]
MTDASLTEELAKQPETVTNAPDNSVFSGGADVKPIVERPD